MLDEDILRRFQFSSRKTYRYNTENTIKLNQVLITSVNITYKTKVINTAQV